MLEEKQVKLLTSYCARQGIRYYDVQLELVDHMAEWIEHAMEESQVSFEQAFEQMKSSFTGRELQEILSSRKKAVAGKINRLFLKEWLSFFTIPKIIITACLYALVFRLPAFITPDKIIYVCVPLINVYVFFYRKWSGGLVYQKNKDKRLPLLGLKLTGTAQVIVVLLLVGQLVVYFLHGLFEMSIPTSYNFIFRLIYPLFLLLIVSFEHVMLAVKKQMHQQYPAAFAI